MGKNNAKAWLSLAMIFALCLCIGGESIAATLRVGSSGEDVKTLQTKLKRWGYYTGSIDGVFGAGTKKAVIAFQKKNGLTPDGIVGAATLKALGMSASGGSGSSSSSGTNTDGNLYLLARLVYGEARGEPYKGAGGRCGGGTEQGEKQPVSEQRKRSDIPKRGVQRCERRADKPDPG